MSVRTSSANEVQGTVGVMSSKKPPRPMTDIVKSRKRKRLLLVAPAMIFLLIFFAYPLFENFLNSINYNVVDGTEPWYEYYHKLFVDTYYRGVVIETIELSLYTTLISIVIGYPIAYFMVRKAGRWTMLLLFFLVAPLLTSIIMRTFGWRVLFARRGIINETLMNLDLIERPLRLLDGPFAVYVGMVHILVPFMVLSIIPVLRNVDLRLEESARVLGAGPLKTFFRITLPLSMDGVVTGAILVFMLTSGSFVTQLLLGNGTVVTLPLLIFQQFSLTQNLNFAAAMGNLLLIVVISCLFLQLRLTDGNRRA